jgi:hypothetical protein
VSVSDSRDFGKEFVKQFFVLQIGRHPPSATVARMLACESMFHDLSCLPFFRNLILCCEA